MTDKISLKEIKKLLKVEADITVYESTDSTNTRLKEAAKEGAANGTVIIAENQTAGRGRLGRQFFSPSQSGIYMSILLRPTEEVDTALLTARTAVAVCEALETVSEKEFQIKWVNDIQKNGKKVCGILAEGGTEQGELKYIIVGIGINVYPPENGFPPDIKNIATSVFETKKENAKNQIIAETLNRFFVYDDSFILKYKEKSSVIGKQITVHQNGTVKNAFALDIDKNCNLSVKYENGSTDTLSFGEISIKTV